MLAGAGFAAVLIGIGVLVGWETRPEPVAAQPGPSGVACVYRVQVEEEDGNLFTTVRAVVGRWAGDRYLWVEPDEARWAVANACRAQ